MEAAIIAGAGLFIGFIMLAILLDNTAGSPIPSYVAPILAVVILIFSLIGSLIALRTSLKAEPAAVFH